MQQTTAAIIIARGGSKRLPRKNTRQMCGHPLVALSIIQAKQSETIDFVWVSTDDDEIQDIAIEYGANVIRRPDWPDADLVAANRVYLDALDQLEEIGMYPDRFVCMFPTSPLRYPDDIDRVVRQHDHCGFHVHPMARNRETTLYRDLLGIEARCVIWDKTYRYMQGNSGLANCVNSNWYRWSVAQLTEAIGDSDALLDKLASDPMTQFDAMTYYVECEAWQCVETDTLKEFELAEVLMNHYILRGRDVSVAYGKDRDITNRRPQ